MHLKVVLALCLILASLSGVECACEAFTNEYEVDTVTGNLHVFCMNDDLQPIQVGDQYVTEDCRLCVCRERALVCCTHYGGDCAAGRLPAK